MLTPIIKQLLVLIICLSTLCSSASAAFLPRLGYAAATPPAPSVTVEPAAPVDPLQGTEYATIERGDSGDAVEQLQQRLSELGYYSGRFTGKMDSATQLAYKKFERANGFTANGVATPEEQLVLYSEAAIPAQ